MHQDNTDISNSWQYSTIHNSPCKVIEEQTLWGQTVCRVWLPNQDAVVRVPSSALLPLNVALRTELEAHRIGYISAAAKVAEVLEGGSNASDGHVLLAPMESNVVPLPHQIHALSRAVSCDRVRYLLADEVGLGKTIEAGLIMRELKLRGLVRRTLVVAPKGLATQWVAEMQTHFNEQFRLVLGDDIGTLQRLVPGSDNGDSPWSIFDQVIVSLDSVKPMDKRRGWLAERVGAYNRSRYEELITAGWDLVIVDETHRLGGSTDQAAERLRSHPLPHWLEKMTVDCLHAHGGKATQKRTGWELTWPDGEVCHRCVFSSRDAQNKPDTLLLNLENNRLRGPALNLPQIMAAQPIPCVSLSGLPPTISGFWALFEIRLQAGMHQQSQLIRIPLVRRRYIAVFQSEEGAVFMPTARHIWDSLQSEVLKVLASMEPDQSIAIYNRLLQVCEDEGKELFDALQQEHQSAIAREEERGAVAFSARRRAIERAGLPEVRYYRTKQCNIEEAGWRRELESARQIVPEIRPLLLMRIMKGGSQ
jgi:hypothetical protein